MNNFTTHIVQRGGRIVLVGLLVMLLGWLRPGEVSAHAAVERAEPEPNSVLASHIHLVTVWFTEAIEPEFSEIRVLNIEGERIDNGDSTVDPDDPQAIYVTLPTVPDGTYTVAWRNVSTVDGHSLSGSYIYSVGQPLSRNSSSGEEAPSLVSSPWEPVVRALILWGLLTVTGGLVFELVIMGRPAGKDKRGKEIQEKLSARMTAVLWVALVVAVVASAGQLLLYAAALFDIPIGQVFGGPLRSALSRTDWGRFWVWRAWLLLLLVMVLAGLTAARASLRPALLRLFQIGALVIALGILFTLSMVSHAAANLTIRTAAIFTDMVHLIAAAFWVGGVIHFAFALPLLLQSNSKERRAWLAALVPRFSTMAILSVGSLIISGLYSSWAQVTTVPALATPYGLTLIVKVALLIPLFVLGAINLVRISPRLSQEETAGWQLRRSVTAEAVIGTLLLAVAGLLISLEPARQVAAREGIGMGGEQAHNDVVEGTDITLTVEPALAGYNQVVVALANSQGQPIDNASQVNLRFSYQEEELGSQEVTAGAGEEAGVYVANDVLLSVGGEWQAEVLVQRPDAFDAQTAFRFALAASSGAPELGETTGQLLWGVELLLIGLLFMATATFMRSRQVGRHPLVAAPGMVALFGGIFLVANAQFGWIAPAGNSRNPIAPTAESLAEGQHLYGEYCVPCHGPMGKGDGPLAAELDPPPADLTVHSIHNPDEYLFNVISNGREETAMPAFDTRLERAQIWHVINYLRSLPVD
jgi:copper transport protein